MIKETLVIASIALVMTGCAQKKLNTSTGIDTSSVTSGPNGTNIGAYENVDPIGQGMGQGSGVYGQGGGTYDQDGTYTQNGTYSQNNGYGNSGGVSNIYFNVNQYHITADKLGEVAHNATLLRKVSGKIKIEGHCDASGTDEYNYALGLRRAKAAKDALMTNGIPANKITLVSMGESAPECETSSSADCYAKNRRVEFKVMQ